MGADDGQVSFIGYWLDKTSGIEADISAANPELLVVGYAAWGMIPQLKKLAPALKWVSLRDTRKPLINRDPEEVANEQCDFIQNLRTQWSAIPLDGVQLVAHGLDEEHGQWQHALDWELRHLLRVHLRGERGCHWNIAFGNYNDAEAQRFKRLWDDADYLGPHLYTGWNSDLQQEADRLETCFRYRKWTGFPRYKCIPTESGFDDWAGTYHGSGKPGWRHLGLSETHVQNEMLEITQEWHADGLAGGIWYAKLTQNSEWEPFYSTPSQEAAWRSLPPVRLRTFDNGGTTMPTLDDVGEKFLQIQRTLNEAKQAASFTVQGAAVDEVFAVAGDGYNLVQDLKAQEISPPV